MSPSNAEALVNQYMVTKTTGQHISWLKEKVIVDTKPFIVPRFQIRNVSHISQKSVLKTYRKSDSEGGLSSKLAQGRRKPKQY